MTGKDKGERENVNKIKVIKSKDAEAAANAKTQSVCQPKQCAPVNEEKIERRLHRELGGAVSNWISERRENNRIEKIAAIRRLFGGEHLANEI